MSEKDTIREKTGKTPITFEGTLNLDFSNIKNLDPEGRGPAGDMTLTVPVPYRILRTLIWDALSFFDDDWQEYAVKPDKRELADIRSVVDKYFQNDVNINGLLEEVERI